LKTDSESLPMIDAGSEFQTDGASKWLMRWLRYCGTDVFRVLYVNTDTL